MEYGQIIRDNNRKVDCLISHIFRMVAFVILAITIFNWKYTFEVDQYLFLGDLLICSTILIIPSIIVGRFKKGGASIRYLIITCSMIVCNIAMAHFIDYTFILSTVPLVLASLYFDRNLSIYATVVSGMMVVGAQLINKFGLISLINGNWSFTRDLCFELTIRGVQYIFIALITIYLSDYCTKIFVKSCNASSELKRNRDGLDVIVDFTDALFCARSFQEVAMIVVMIIRSLLNSLGKDSTMLKGYVGIRESKDLFRGVDERIKSKEFKVNNHEILVTVEGEEYILPIDETEERNTVFVNKNKLTMFFYSEGELNAFVILHMHLAQTEAVLNKLVRVLYRNIKLAIDNISLTRDMYQTQEELVRAFSEISESKSGQTGAHIKRVSEYMKIMAQALKLDKEEKDSLVLASMMHDIGKLMIPEQILDKPGKLTQEEFEVIKTHVQYGYKLLEFCPGRIMEIARMIALQHHEKWDGTGYLGLCGDEIDYYSRIMAVVDVFDALMSKRSYKDSWSIEEAYNEIVSQSGKYFDPQIVKLFEDHFGEFLEVLSNYPDTQKTA